jgi:hypothetical protein
MKKSGSKAPDLRKSNAPSTLGLGMGSKMTKTQRKGPAKKKVK